MALSREERIAAAEKRVKDNYSKKDEGLFSGKTILDLSSIGGYNKELFYSPIPNDWNAIDIIPFIVKNKNYPIKHMIGKPDYCLDVWVHKRIGAKNDSVICLEQTLGGKNKCPICEDNRAQVKGLSKNEIKKLGLNNPQRRCFYNVLDLEIDERKQKVQLFDVAHFLFEQKLLIACATRGGGVIPFYDIEEGKTIEFYAQAKKVALDDGQVINTINYEGIKLVDRNPYTEDIYKEANPLDELLIIPTYEEVRDIYYNVSGETDDEKDEEERPRRQGRESVSARPVRGKKNDEENDSENLKSVINNLKSSSRKRNIDDEEKPSRSRSERPRRNRDTEDSDEVPQRRRRNREDDNDQPEEPRSRKSRSRAAEKDDQSECPHGYTFGEDNNMYRECSECDQGLFSDCNDACEG